MGDGYLYLLLNGGLCPLLSMNNLHHSLYVVYDNDEPTYVDLGAIAAITPSEFEDGKEFHLIFLSTGRFTRATGDGHQLIKAWSDYRRRMDEQPQQTQQILFAMPEESGSSGLINVFGEGL